MKAGFRLLMPKVGSAQVRGSRPVAPRTLESSAAARARPPNTDDALPRSPSWRASRGGRRASSVPFAIGSVPARGTRGCRTSTPADRSTPRFADCTHANAILAN
jgi:hypothetical protein